MNLMVKFFSFYTYQSANNVFDKKFYRDGLDYPSSINNNDESFRLTSHDDESTQLYDINNVDSFYTIEICADQQKCFEFYNDMIKCDMPREECD